MIWLICGGLVCGFGFGVGICRVLILVCGRVVVLWLLVGFGRDWMVCILFCVLCLLILSVFDILMCCLCLWMRRGSCSWFLFMLVVLFGLVIDCLLL